MPILNKGTAFSNGEQLTADKLNDLVDLATFDQSATDSASTTVNTSGQIAVADSGVSTAKIADANVTTAKIADANVTFAKLTDVIDDDTMATATNTTLATSESIKAFIEGLIGTTDKSGTGVVTEGTQGSIVLGGGLIVKFGSVDVNSSQVTLTFKDSSGSNSAFPTAIYGVMVTAQEDSGNSAESAGVSDLALASCTVRGYNSNSGGAVGRVFFIAIGH